MPFARTLPVSVPLGVMSKPSAPEASPQPSGCVNPAPEGGGRPAELPLAEARCGDGQPPRPVLPADGRGQVDALGPAEEVLRQRHGVPRTGAVEAGEQRETEVPLELVRRWLAVLAG